WRERYRPQSGRAAMVDWKGHHHGTAWFTGDDSIDRTPCFHHGFDARRSGAWRGATPRYDRGPGEESNRRGTRRGAREPRDRRRRRGRHRHGTVVDLGNALAAAASGVRVQGP